MLEMFREWFRINAGMLAGKKIDFILSNEVKSSSNNAASVNIETDRHGATVIIWEDGQSDLHFVEWETANGASDIEVTHYDFSGKEDLYAALENLITRIS